MRWKININLHFHTQSCLRRRLNPLNESIFFSTELVSFFLQNYVAMMMSWNYKMKESRGNALKADKESEKEHKIENSRALPEVLRLEYLYRSVGQCISGAKKINIFFPLSSPTAVCH